MYLQTPFYCWFMYNQLIIATPIMGWNHQTIQEYIEYATHRKSQFKIIHLHITTLKFWFNKTPLGPQGTNMVICDVPDAKSSFVPYGTEAWYIRPTKDYYRCYIFYNPTAWHTRISWFLQFLSTYYNLSYIPPVDT